MNGAAGGLPSPTRKVDQAVNDLHEHGLCIMADALAGQRLGAARKALYAAAQDDHETGRVTTGFVLDRDDRNQRVWNLLNRDPLFSELAVHPLALRFVREILGWPALLSNISGNITRPDSAAGVLHADQVFAPEPWPRRPHGLNVAWCIDDFSEDNGATEVVPGSHLLNRGPRDDEAPESVPVVAAAGSIIAFDSRVWHRTGANRSSTKNRAAVFPFYTTTIFRTQENWFLSLEPWVKEAASDELLTLLAFRSEGFGLVYGRSPE